jgi:antitoxin YefM
MRALPNVGVKIASVNKARATLYRLVDEVCDSHEPVVITGKRNNAVLVSQEDWNNIQETLYLGSIPGMVESIKAAAAELREEAIPLEALKELWA